MVTMSNLMAASFMLTGKALTVSRAVLIGIVSVWILFAIVLKIKGGKS